jgi:hypothetical protein
MFGNVEQPHIFLLCQPQTRLLTAVDALSTAILHHLFLLSWKDDAVFGLLFVPTFTLDHCVLFAHTTFNKVMVCLLALDIGTITNLLDATFH